MFYVYKRAESINVFSFQFLIPYSYGLYVFHQFVLMFLIYKLDIYQYLNHGLAPIILFIITTIVSLVVTNFFIKTKIGKFLIG